MALIFAALSRSVEQLLNGGAKFIIRCFDEVDMDLLGFGGARWILQNFPTLQAACFVASIGKLGFCLFLNYLLICVISFLENVIFVVGGFWFGLFFF
jgi:hypothetical protein